MKMTEEQKKERKLKKEKEKIEKKKLEEAQRIENNLKRELEDVRRKNQFALSKPNFRYEVGENIQYWKDCRVLEVLDNGEVYKIESGDFKKTIRYVSFLDIHPKGKIQSNEDLHDKDNTLGIHFYNQDLSSLCHYHYKGINYNPVYQRDFVWSQKDKENLIDSLMNKIEIGKFVLIELPFDYSKKDGGFQYEILDGKQRLNTIIQFLENQFSYKGKLFCELSIQDKNFLMRSIFSVAIGKEDEWSMKRKMKYFLKLNTGGIAQSEEHLKNVKEMLKNESK